MYRYIMTESELKFAELVWEREPIGSGELVKLCEKKYQWKKSTTYTVLKKLCEKRILKNEAATVSSLVKKDDYQLIKSERFIEDNFGGSLPKFVAAFIDRKKLSKKQIAEIQDMIDNFKEE